MRDLSKIFSNKSNDYNSLAVAVNCIKGILERHPDNFLKIDSRSIYSAEFIENLEESLRFLEKAFNCERSK
jgi:hypothetical protein